MSVLTQPVNANQTHAMQCMEIWGSNQAIADAISVPGIDAWVLSSPYQGADRGGDIHYISLCGGGKIARFFVADVSGHGEMVGDLAERFRALMRRNINTLDQTRFARAINEQFSLLSDAGQFATALLATYYTPTDHLVLCNAGHLPPLLYRARTGVWRRLSYDFPECENKVANLPLGVIQPTEYCQYAVQLFPGDLVLIYTDALVEASNLQGQMLGEEGLLAMVEEMDVQAVDQLASRLIEQVAAYRQDQPAEDDMTVLVLHHNGANPPRQSLGQMAKVLGKVLGLIEV